MIKAVLFDIDGIVVVGREKYFSLQYAEKHNVPKEDVEAFFLGDFKKCVFGTCDLKKEIASYLPRWQWKDGVDAFLEYWFNSESTTDPEVLNIIDALRAKGYPCYIASRQEKYRMQYLLETVGLKKHFDGTFCTCDIGHDKSEPEFWQEVLKELGLKPEEVLFFDDKKKNVAMACSLGIQAYFYDSIEVLRTQTKNI